MDAARTANLKARLAAALGERFELGEPIGAGGFAAVFRAHDPVLHRDVAIKVLNPELALAGGAASALMEEARLVAAIEHPHIVPLYEVSSHAGLVILVMRYYPDGTATSLLAREGALQAARVAQVGIEVADALAAAHARGVVHLDIKPDNLLVDASGHVAVADFGIARVLSAAGERAPGLVAGSPHYMSPEQVAGDRVDGRTDLYALGITLYQLATGRRPITGDSMQAIMANQVRQPPPPLESVVPDFPRPLAEVIMRALAKDPDQRWATAREMGDALRTASESHQLLTPKAARRRGRKRWYRRGVTVVAGLAAGFLLLGYFVVRLYQAYDDGVPPAIDALAPLIPAAMLDSVRAHGVLAPGDSLVYLFAPNGKGLADALLVTRSELVALRNWEPTRYALAEDPDITLAFKDREGAVLVRRKGGTTTDTLYAPITGMEQQVLMLGLKRSLPATDR